MSHNSKVPRRNSSTVSSPASLPFRLHLPLPSLLLKSVNAASGYFSQMARSSAVIVSQPNVNMYRPGSVTRPTCGQVSLLTANHFPFAFSPCRAAICARNLPISRSALWRSCPDGSSRAVACSLVPISSSSCNLAALIFFTFRGPSAARPPPCPLSDGGPYLAIQIAANRLTRRPTVA